MNTLQWLGCVGLPATPVDHAGAARILKVERTATIDAPVSVVWARCSDFNAIDTWLRAVAKTTLTHGKNNVPGAVRHLDVGGGGHVDEELLEYAADEHRFVYRILSGVLPVSGYRSSFAVTESGADKAIVTWTSTFQRKDTGANPPAGADDKTALKAITELYETGLADLKRVVEGG